MATRKKPIGKSVFVGTHISAELNKVLSNIAAQRLITKGAVIRQILAKHAASE